MARPIEAVAAYFEHSTMGRENNHRNLSSQNFIFQRST
jgi:hypothetical protein